MAVPVLDDLLAVNDELAALHSAGVDLQLGLGEWASSERAAWTQIGAALGREVGRGESLEQALRSGDTGLPRTYRHLMLLALEYGQLRLSLDCARRPAAVVDRSRSAVRASVAYPLLVACLAYVGMIAFLKYVVPLLMETTDVPGMHPGYWITTFDALRSSMPIWAWIPPLLLVLWWANRWWRARQQHAPASWLADAMRVSQQQQMANFAEICATLLDQGVAPSEAVHVAAGACGDAGLADAARGLETVWRAGAKVEPGDPLGNGFPPLVRWALLQGDSEPERANALRAAASTYRRMAVARTDRAQRWLPVLLVVLVGGGVVLLYGVMLLLPVREMLEALAH
jgi:type II secretory pathway component PulF